MIYKYIEQYIVFSEDIFKKLQTYRQLKGSSYEAGGILLGKVYEDTVYIDTMSEPSSEDKAGRFFFNRNVKKAQCIVEDAWNDSNGERIYLGEWHTHPERNPKPSKDDQSLIENMVTHTKMEIDYLIMVIVGTSDLFVGVKEKSLGLKKLCKLNSNEGIEAHIFYENGYIFGFQVTGYVNYSNKGYDIFNAALSTISIGTINAILTLVPLKDYTLLNTQGFLKFIITNPLEKESHKDVNLLLGSMLVQLQLLKDELEYKTNLSLTIFERNYF